MLGIKLSSKHIGHIGASIPCIIYLILYKYWSIKKPLINLLHQGFWAWMRSLLKTKNTGIKNMVLLFVADNMNPFHFCSIYFDSNISYRQVATSASHSRKNFLFGTIVSFNQFWFSSCCHTIKKKIGMIKFRQFLA